jgi:excisionase family DNA binding protein
VEKLLSRRELAELLGVPTQSIASWASQGIGPTYVIVGRHARYRPADVEKWLASRAREGASS